MGEGFGDGTTGAFIVSLPNDSSVAPHPLNHRRQLSPS